MTTAAFAGPRVGLAAIAFLATTAGAPAGEPAPPEPSGYRMEDYRAPTPAALSGAETIGAREAEALWRGKGATFIDTMPRDVKPANLPSGTVWRDKARDHIPGSAWLANVGYGALNAEMTAYFRDALGALTGGDKARPLLFYCRAECWMSWNAGKRAIEWGYAKVYWFPEGSDGWQAAGLPLEPATPYALKDVAAPQ